MRWHTFCTVWGLSFLNKWSILELTSGSSATVCPRPNHNFRCSSKSGAESLMSNNASCFELLVSNASYFGHSSAYHRRPSLKHVSHHLRLHLRKLSRHVFSFFSPSHSYATFTVNPVMSANPRLRRATPAQAKSRWRRTASNLSPEAPARSP